MTTTLVSQTKGADGTEGGARRGVLWVYPPAAVGFTPFGPPTLVGRDPECDKVIEGAELSRRHAFIVQHGSKATIRDVGSTNGTFVNGEKISEVALQLGDVVRVGDGVGVCTAVAEGDEATPFVEHASGLLVGPTLRRAIGPAVQVAGTDLPVVLVGETGAGKEMVAQAIHLESRRNGFHAVNCAALPEQLVEAELFGYRKGAFTGATSDQVGRLRAADGGTLLLDELLDLPVRVQPKLLRALEQREVTPLGGTSTVTIDVRLVCATQEPLAELVARGQFRSDLQARLEGVVVHLPPLRERREEVLFLFLKLWARTSGARTVPKLSPRFVERLCTHDWPLNVRELHFFTRRLHAFHGGEPVLRRLHFDNTVSRPAEPRPKGEAASGPVNVGPKSSPFDDLGKDEQMRALVDAVRSARGNIAQAASSLGITRQRAYRLLRGFDLDDLRSS